MNLWLREVLGIAAVAAAAAFALPRLVLPPAVAHRHRPPARAVEAPAPPAPVITLGDPPAAPDPEPAAPSPPSNALAAPAVPRRAAPRQAAPSPRLASLPRGALSRRAGRWVVDLHALPPVRTALAGAQLQPPGEGAQSEGYRVVRTDRMGLLDAAGIRPGDVLVGVDGRPLRNPDEALDAYSRLHSANRATFDFRRGGARYSVPVELVGRDGGRSLLR